MIFAMLSPYLANEVIAILTAAISGGVAEIPIGIVDIILVIEPIGNVG